MSRTVLFLALIAVLLAAPAALAVPVAAQTPTPVCDCSADLYNCADDFANQQEAQACYDACFALTGLDVHQLDHDGDGLVCESLPPGPPTVTPSPSPTATETPAPSATSTIAPTVLPTIVVQAIVESEEPGGPDSGLVSAVIGAVATIVAAVMAVVVTNWLSSRPKPPRSNPPDPKP